MSAAVDCGGPLLEKEIPFGNLRGISKKLLQGCEIMWWKIVFSCLQKVNSTQLDLISHNLGRSFYKLQINSSLDGMEKGPRDRLTMGESGISE